MRSRRPVTPDFWVRSPISVLRVSKIRIVSSRFSHEDSILLYSKTEMCRAKPHTIIFGRGGGEGDLNSVYGSVGVRYTWPHLGTGTLEMLRYRHKAFQNT